MVESGGMLSEKGTNGVLIAHVYPLHELPSHHSYFSLVFDGLGLCLHEVPNYISSLSSKIF